MHSSGFLAQDENSQDISGRNASIDEIISSLKAFFDKDSFNQKSLENWLAERIPKTEGICSVAVFPFDDYQLEVLVDHDDPSGKNTSERFLGIDGLPEQDQK